MEKFLTSDYRPAQLARSYSEYFHGGLDISVVDRVQSGVENMRSLGFNEQILRVLSQGYVIPFAKPLAPFARDNNASARRDLDFVRSAVNDLIHAKAVTVVDSPSYIMNPLMVAARGAKKGLVLDCRHINRCLKIDKVAIEGPDILAKFVQREGFMITFDIKKGYHHMPIHANS